MTEQISNERVFSNLGAPALVEDAQWPALDDPSRFSDKSATSKGPEFAPSVGEDCPFDLRLARPQVLDVRQLHALLGLEIPAQILAALGATRPLLLIHTMTPFAADGRQPPPIAALDYEVELIGVPNATTVSLAPATEHLEVFNVKQKVTLGLEMGGGLHLPAEAVELIDALPGLTFQGVSIQGAQAQSFSLALSYTCALLKIIAGPTGAGGAKWTLYHQDDTLMRAHTLIQTLMVPEDTTALNLRLDSHIRRRTWLPASLRFGTHQWRTPTWDLNLPIDA